MTARRWALAAVVLAVVALAGLGMVRAAGGPPPTQRERVEAVSATIRCPTCQGLSIKDSSSVLAAGSRRIVEEQVAQGRSDDEIRQYFVDRYGEFILLEPERDGAGLVVWVVPLLALPAAGLLAWRWVRDRRAGALAVPAGGADDDGEAAAALAAHRSGALEPDASPAGEALREALVARAVLDEEDAPAPGAVRHADARLAAAHRRYRTRPAVRRSGPARRPLPRRVVTAVTVGLLVVGAGTALALGTRTRGANDLPTGDLPAGVAAAGQELATLIATTRERPEDGAAWLALGRAYQGLEQYTQAVDAYDRAVRTGAGDEALLQRSDLLVKTGSPREALPALQDLVTRRPDDPDTVLLLGLAQRASGSPDSAATLRRFLELAPDAPAAAGVRSLLGEQ